MNRAEVKRLIRHIGLRPARAAGQHFLLDDTVAEAMVEAAGVKLTDTILEIGPGLGALTTKLLDRGATVMAVELDRRLAGFLRQRFADRPRLTIIHQDIFQVNIPRLFDQRPYKVVANLPYGATSLVLRNFLSLPPLPSTMTVMVQKEVAHRMIARPGRMSQLGVMVQYYSQPRVLFDVPRASFFPVPEVVSTVVQCAAIRPRDTTESGQLFRLTKAAFASKRKQLHNALRSMVKDSDPDLPAELFRLGINPQLRPQDLSVEDWRRMAKMLF